VWGNEPSHSQVNSHCRSWNPKWTPKFSEHNCTGQNPLVWIFFIIIRILLKRRCLKWARMTHLDIWGTSYDQKKSRESNWQFDSQPLKVGNPPDFRLQVACNILLKSSWQGLQLCFRPHCNWRSAREVMGPQSCWSPSCGNFGTPTWGSRDKMPFGCGPYGET
jgi:hypothetical protein